MHTWQTARRARRRVRARLLVDRRGRGGRHVLRELRRVVERVVQHDGVPDAHILQRPPGAVAERAVDGRQHVQALADLRAAPAPAALRGGAGPAPQGRAAAAGAARRRVPGRSGAKRPGQGHPIMQTQRFSTPAQPRTPAPPVACSYTRRRAGPLHTPSRPVVRGMQNAVSPGASACMSVRACGVDTTQVAAGRAALQGLHASGQCSQDSGWLHSPRQDGLRQARAAPRQTRCACHRGSRGPRRWLCRTARRSGSPRRLRCAPPQAGLRTDVAPGLAGGALCRERARGALAMPSTPLRLWRRCGRISSSKKRACGPYMILRGGRCGKLQSALPCQRCTEPASVRRGGPVDGVPAAPEAGRVAGLRDEVLLHVVEQAVVVVLDPARPGMHDGVALSCLPHFYNISRTESTSARPGAGRRTCRA